MKGIRIFACYIVLSSSFTGFASADTMLNVKDFGAVGNGSHDDAPAFRKAIDKALSINDKVIITIPKGKYFLKNPTEIWTNGGNKHPADADAKSKKLRAILSVDHAKNLTISGSPSSKLIIGDPTRSGLSISHSENVTIRNLEFDYDPLPFTQGSIVSVSPRNHSVKVRIDSGFTPPNTPNFHKAKVIRRIVFYDSHTDRLDFKLPDYKIRDAKQVSAGVWHLQLTGNNAARAYPHVGSKAVMMARFNGRPALFINMSKNVHLEHVQVHAAPGGGFSLRSSSAVALDHCSVAPPGHSGRLLSTNADAVHVHDNRVGPKIVYGNFIRQGDDGINIGTGLLSILDVDDHGKVLTLHLPENAEIGDTMKIIDSRTGATLGRSSISSITRKNGKAGVRVGLSSPVSVSDTVHSMGLLAHIKMPRTHRIIPTLAVDINLAGKHALISHNVFRGNRARGILIRAHDAAIDGNTFEHIAGPAIVAGFELNFTEGSSVQNLTISDNVFSDVALSNILVGNTAQGHFRFLPEGMDNRNVNITGNRFIGIGHITWRDQQGLASGITISNTDGANISGNQFRAKGGRDSRPLIFLGHVRNIRVSNNHMINNDGKITPANVSVGSSADTASIQIKH